MTRTKTSRATPGRDGTAPPACGIRGNRSPQRYKRGFGARGETVKISGFGRLEIRTRAARRGRDPVSGDIRTLSPRPHLSFRPSKLLKEKVNP